MKQHTGRVSDAIDHGDLPRPVRIKPRALPRNMGDMGDGDPCPDGHGRMYANSPNQTQYCPHRDHDGYPKTHPGGETAPTRSRWPLGHNAFAKAVAERRILGNPRSAEHLPDLDFDLEDL